MHISFNSIPGLMYREKLGPIVKKMFKVKCRENIITSMPTML